MLIKLNKNSVVLFMYTESAIHNERARFVTCLRATFPLPAEKKKVKILCYMKIPHWTFIFLICAISSYEYEVNKCKNSTTNMDQIKDFTPCCTVGQEPFSFPQLITLLVPA